MAPRVLESPNPRGSLGVVAFGLNGLVEGVGLEVFGIRPIEFVLGRTVRPAGEKREGRVPARALPRMAEVAPVVSTCGCAKSGKLSALGDSGMVSRSGVEFPLVGGPQI